MRTDPLPLAFYRRPALEVARDLLGREICRRLEDGTVLRGAIVETEAYDGPKDRASHAFRGETDRNRSMFRAGGIAYVYLIYGMYHCFNVVCGEESYPAAILVRAAEWPSADRNSTGPGRLCRAFEIDRAFDGGSLSGAPLWLEEGSPVSERTVKRTARINIDSSGPFWSKRKYRFCVTGNPRVSGPRSLR